MSFPNPQTVSPLLPGLGCFSFKDASPSTWVCEPMSCASRLSCNGASLPTLLCTAPLWVRTHFTETENSPGELSLSRIRKAPRWFRFIRISSASCREILPEYHLQGDGAGEGSGKARLPPSPCAGHPTSLLFTADPRHRKYDCTHFTDEEAEAPRRKATSTRVHAEAGRTWDPIPAFWLPSASLSHLARQISP